MATRSRAGKRAARTLEGTSLKSSVFTAASLKRDRNPKRDTYYRYLAELHPDNDGNLVAVASCGDDAFVCTRAEIPVFIEFLQSLIAAGKSA